MNKARKWTDLLEDDVYIRLANCVSLKSDVLPLAQAKWSIMKHDAGFTKEDALVCVLELLDCNSVEIDLTRDEYDGILCGIV